MNTEALRKLANMQKKADGELARLAPWLGLLAGGALGHTVAKSTEDDDGESMWSKVRRWLGALAGGAAGFYAGGALAPTKPSAMKDTVATTTDAAGYIGDAATAALATKGILQGGRALVTQPIGKWWSGGTPVTSGWGKHLNGGVKGGLQNLGIAALTELAARGLHYGADKIRNMD